MRQIKVFPLFLAKANLLAAFEREEAPIRVDRKLQTRIHRLQFEIQAKNCWHNFFRVWLSLV